MGIAGEVPIWPAPIRRLEQQALVLHDLHVKELLGHESLETLKHYAKLTITDLRATHETCCPREKDAKVDL